MEGIIILLALRDTEMAEMMCDEVGCKMSTTASAQKIKPFVDFYGINMNDFTPSDITQYETFQDFFTRRHTAESRSICAPDDPVTSTPPSPNGSEN